MSPESYAMDKCTDSGFAELVADSPSLSELLWVRLPRAPCSRTRVDPAQIAQRQRAAVLAGLPTVPIYALLQPGPAAPTPTA